MSNDLNENLAPRKFTLGHLEIRRLNGLDLLFILLFIVLTSLTFYFWHQDGKNYFIPELVTSFFSTYLVILSTFGLRLRSVYFSLIWLLISMIYAINVHSLAYVPILDFLLYHFLRLVFWKKYNKEFIPFTVGRGRLYRFISEIEKQGGTTNDKNFMKLLICLGVMIYAICFIGVIGLKAK